jgi:hypothetical protein
MKKIVAVLFAVAMAVSIMAVSASAESLLGTAVISGPDTVYSGGDIEYTATLNTSPAIQGMIVQYKDLIALNRDQLTFTFVVKLDSNLTAKQVGGKYVYTFVSPILEVNESAVTVDANGYLNVPCRLKEGFNTNPNLAADLAAPWTLVGTATLSDADYTSVVNSDSKTIVTGGSIVVATTNPNVQALIGGPSTEISAADFTTHVSMPFYKFDVNRDGSVDGFDISYMVRIYQEIYSYDPGSEQEQWALKLFDANNDGVIDGYDITEASRVYQEITPMYTVDMPTNLVTYYPAG